MVPNWSNFHVYNSVEVLLTKSNIIVKMLQKNGTTNTVKEPIFKEPQILSKNQYLKNYKYCQRTNI